jgi:acyl-CoA thioester hydrolase
MSHPPPSVRADYRWFCAITTRWMDNDVYGHVNNVVYYGWIDTAVNRFLLDHGVLDLASSPAVGVVAETGCRYLSPIAFPDDVTVGIRVTRLGRSSVRYAVGIFGGTADAASAEGHFVHVYVARAGMRPVAIPEAVRIELERITGPE